MASIVLGKNAERKLQAAPLSDNIISSRIYEISYDILNQVITDIKNSQQKSHCNWMNPQIPPGAVSS